MNQNALLPIVEHHEIRPTTLWKAVRRVGAIAAMSSTLAACGPADSPAKSPDFKITHTVIEGETLSEIADKICLGDQDAATNQDQVVDLQIANSLNSDQVHTGQRIEVPADLCEKE